MENYRNQFCMKTKMMFSLMETAVTKSGKITTSIWNYPIEIIDSKNSHRDIHHDKYNVLYIILYIKMLKYYNILYKLY